MKCKWCNRPIDPPAKAHTYPPCDQAPARWHKKWKAGQAQRDQDDETLDVIARMAGGKI